MSESFRFEILGAILCDDVRREDNGKDIIIGVYSGGIIINELPAPLALKVWIQLRHSGAGQTKLRVEINLEGENLAGVEMMMGTQAEVGAGSLFTPTVPVLLTKEGMVSVTLQQGEGEPQQLMQLPVTLKPS
jgi:hypothetical protein